MTALFVFWYLNGYAAKALCYTKHIRYGTKRDIYYSVGHHACVPCHCCDMAPVA